MERMGSYRPDGHVAPSMQGKMQRDDVDSMHKSITELDQHPNMSMTEVC